VGIPSELLGPIGLTIGAIAVVVTLWREHQRSDRDMKVDRDYWRDLAMTGANLADKSTTIALRKRVDDA